MICALRHERVRMVCVNVWRQKMRKAKEEGKIIQYNMNMNKLEETRRRGKLCIKTKHSIGKKNATVRSAQDV